MLGRNDGLVWDCADFSADGTHPSSTYGQLKVATALLNFLKTDDTTIPWYLAPSLALTSIGGNGQTGNVGATLPTPLTVFASNLNGGAAQSGVTVTFSDGGAGGTFGSPTATTDINGDASTTYTLPATAKTVTISVISSGYASASFSETANANVQLLNVSAGNNQTGGVGSMLPTALTVQATLNGNPAAGVTVNFSDGGVGGILGSPTAITDSNGIASTTYTLPTIAQVVTISATASGYGSASFTETATNLQLLSVTTGNNQTGGVGTTLPAALGVSATLNGNPVAGVNVTFSDGGVGGTFSNPTVTTDANGLASSTYTLPANAQTVNITVSASGYTSARFTETAAVESIAVNGGNNQNGNVSTTLSTALAVLATNNGSPVAGLNVTFDDGGAGGNFGSPNATTDSNGFASTTYTLPSTAQTVTVRASSSGYTSATFTETASVQLLAPNAGNNQTGNPGTTLPSSLTVLATSNGTPVAGVAVTFNDGGAGGSFGSPAIATDSNGLASSTYTLPATAKAVTISAGALGYTSASFTETAAVLTLTATSGNSQTGPTGSPLLNPLVVTATNNGSPVAGVTVTFSDNGAGGSFGTPVGTTASDGTASTTYTPPLGSASITASSLGYTSASFTETGTAGVATLTIVSGGKQSATVGTTLPSPLVIKAKNSTGGIVVGASISFSDGAGGTFSPNPAVTGSNGQASTSYTLPKIAKIYTATASVGSISVRASETAVVGPPAIFTIGGGNNQTAHPNTTLSKSLLVKLTDQYSNPIANATVTFTDNGAGGTFSTTTPITNKVGQASVTYTTGPATGTVTITATTSGVSSLSFKETVK
jgi:adhesin/invasin